MQLPKKVLNKNYKRFRKALRDAKRRVIGRGAFSRVYVHPTRSNLVIKVGDPRVDQVSDDPYLAFLRAIRQTNPHYPKIRSIKLYRDTQGKKRIWYVVVMEKLVRLSSVSKQKSTEVVKKTLRTHDLERLIAYRPLRGPIEQVRKTIRNLIAKRRKSAPTKRFYEDIHDGNCLLRKDAKGALTLVVTDPIA